MWQPKDVVCRAAPTTEALLQAPTTEALLQAVVPE